MSRKDIIILSVLANAGLLIILLFSALTTKESYFVASSAKVAESILDNNENGMIPRPKIEEPLVIEKEDSFVKLEDPDDIIHKLPSIVIDEVVVKKEKIKGNRFIEWIVKKGDNLEKIAKLNKTTISEVIKINELSNTVLRIGQTLLVPRLDVKKEVPKTSIQAGNYYTVKCGDNPWTIAIKHHLRVDELLRLNNLNNETAKKLRPGDKLKIR
jgi:LysM repeat protein